MTWLPERFGCACHVLGAAHSFQADDVACRTTQLVLVPGLFGVWGCSAAKHSEARECIVGCTRAGYCGFVPAAAGAPQGQQQPGDHEARQADMLLLTLDQYSRG